MSQKRKLRVTFIQCNRHRTGRFTANNHANSATGREGRLLSNVTENWVKWKVRSIEEDDELAHREQNRIWHLIMGLETRYQRPMTAPHFCITHTRRVFVAR
jgi:hypothetical protein